MSWSILPLSQYYIHYVAVHDTLSAFLALIYVLYCNINFQGSYVFQGRKRTGIILAIMSCSPFSFDKRESTLVSGHSRHFLPFSTTVPHCYCGNPLPTSSKANQRERQALLLNWILNFLCQLVGKLKSFQWDQIPRCTGLESPERKPVPVAHGMAFVHPTHRKNWRPSSIQTEGFVWISWLKARISTQRTPGPHQSLQRLYACFWISWQNPECCSQVQVDKEIPVFPR